MSEVKIITMTETDLEDLLQRTVQETVSQMMKCGFTSNNAREENDLIGTTDACRILGCSSRTMQRYRDGKYFTVVMVGPKKAMYYRSEILAFRDAHTRANRNNLK